MEIIVGTDGSPTVKFDLILTLALSALVLYVGALMQSKVHLLRRSNIPRPVLGGLLFGIVVSVLHSGVGISISVDGLLRSPLQIAFFSTIGLSATASVFRSGGRRMLIFACIIAATAIVQNVVGIALARVLHLPDTLGIICGSLTLTGGPATGLAFAETFERLGLPSASALIIASATFGICAASIVGNPVATLLIRRLRLAPAAIIASEFDDNARLPVSTTHSSTPPTSAVLLHNLLVLLTVMGLGSIVSTWFTGLGLILPNFMGAIAVAAILRNVDDRYHWFAVDPRAVDVIGSISLALFLAVALMDLKLWQLAQLASPLVIILTIQVVVTVAYAIVTTFLLLGRDYEAAVATTGHIGFGVGIATNAVANMEALTKQYGPAPWSFVTVPVVCDRHPQPSHHRRLLARCQLIREARERNEYEEALT